MKLRITVLMLSTLFFLASCEGNKQDDRQQEKLLKQLSSSYSYDGEEVELEGYLGLPRLITDSIYISLNSEPIKQGDDASIAYLKMKLSKEPNSYFVRYNKIQIRYVPEQVDVYDSEGKRSPLRSKVKIKGKVVYTHKDWQGKIDENHDTSPMTDKERESLKKNQEELRQEAEARRAETGDANSYDYRISVNNITVLDKK